MERLNRESFKNFFSLKQSARLAFHFCLFLFFFVYLFPTLIIILISLFLYEREKGFSLSFSSFLTLFLNLGFLRILFRTLTLSAFSSFFTVITSVILCYLMVISFKKKLVGWIVVILSFPLWTNLLVRIIPFVILINFFGAENWLLGGNFAIFISFIYLFFPLVFATVFSGVSAINPALIEASLDLGGSKQFTFFHLVIPQLFSTIKSSFMIMFSSSISTLLVSNYVGENKVVLFSDLINWFFFRQSDFRLVAASALTLWFSSWIVIFMFTLFSDRRKEGKLPWIL